MFLVIIFFATSNRGGSNFKLFGGGLFGEINGHFYNFPTDIFAFLSLRYRNQYLMS
jgi:hypothetical protein